MTQYTPTGKKVEQFWSRVDNSNGPLFCWVWKGAIDDKGYGRQGPHLAHRIAWKLTNGPIPLGLHCCHHCDNPICVNPAHLFLGTAADNIHDMMKKGRQSMQGQAKLTAADVQTIRERYASGECSQVQLAEEYGVTQSNIGYLVRGKSWKNVPMYSTPEELAALRDSYRLHPKLTAEDVRTIRARYASGQSTYQQLAEEYDISNSRISDIMNGKAYLFVDP